ncbi:hypothetical protein [Polaribacter sp. SA4-12]|uniref:hypothetical protein n=1 Tax=Polaribacter sp. SA4-12 TaxID=1312072 RepID=UPI000B3C2934|nr:hypothetical protein [Polaribacter sp. SA4-12]ARV16507.1 hypothetical protein BTO07_15785 [Polaribacter sp. SA4-12]
MLYNKNNLPPSPFTTYNTVVFSNDCIINNQNKYIDIGLNGSSISIANFNIKLSTVNVAIFKIIDKSDSEIP